MPRNIFWVSENIEHALCNAFCFGHIAIDIEVLMEIDMDRIFLVVDIMRKAVNDALPFFFERAKHSIPETKGGR